MKELERGLSFLTTGRRPAPKPNRPRCPTCDAFVTIRADGTMSSHGRPKCPRSGTARVLVQD